MPVVARFEDPSHPDKIPTTRGYLVNQHDSLRNDRSSAHWRRPVGPLGTSTQIYEGTNQIQRVVIAKAARIGFLAPLGGSRSPGSLPPIPTPAEQPRPSERRQ